MRAHDWEMGFDDTLFAGFCGEEEQGKGLLEDDLGFGRDRGRLR